LNVSFEYEPAVTTMFNEHFSGPDNAIGPMYVLVVFAGVNFGFGRK